MAPDTTLSILIDGLLAQPAFELAVLKSESVG
jgi:hypothetical protein